MIDKLKSISKIAGALVLSYTVVILLADVFFIDNTPTVRSHPEMYLAQKFGGGVSEYISKIGGSVVQKTTPLMSVEKYKEFMSSEAAKNLKQVSTGTYAAEIEGKKVEIIKLNEISMQEYTYTLKSGQQIKVRVPVGSTPPTQAEVEE